MNERTGWLLDLHTHPDDGAVLWLLGDDGHRHRLHQHFPVTFYAAGPSFRLQALRRHLRAQPLSLSLSRIERRGLFHKHPIPLLAICVNQTALQPRLFQQIADRFPDLNYYNADISLTLRYAAHYDTHPLTRCRVVTDPQGAVQEIEALDSPWNLDPEPPPLRILFLKPSHNPLHTKPSHLISRFEQHEYRFALHPSRPLLVHVAALLRRHDPDLLLTAWGDSWLLPHLLTFSNEQDIPLPLNREPRRDVIRRPNRSYFSYGQVIYRGPPPGTSLRSLAY